MGTFLDLSKEFNVISFKILLESSITLVFMELLINALKLIQLIANSMWIIFELDQAGSFYAMGVSKVFEKKIYACLDQLHFS